MFLVSMTHDTRLHNIILLVDGRSFTGEFAAYRHSGFGPDPLFCDCLLVFKHHESHADGKGDGPEHGGEYQTRHHHIADNHVIDGECLCQSMRGSSDLWGLSFPTSFAWCWGLIIVFWLPACLLGGGAYMVACDLLARALPQQGEMPAGVITALIGAPLFVYLLKRSGR